MDLALAPPARLASCALVVLTLSGCAAIGAVQERSSTIQLQGASKPQPARHVEDRYSAVLRVAPYADKRSTASTRKIGEIRATVLDIHATELVVDREVSGIVTAALTDQLVASGLRIRGDANDVASTVQEDFEISGSVADFTLNIAARDELSIAVESTVRDARDGRVVWSGVVSEKRDRYAGVTGNSKRTIVGFLDEALETVARRTAEHARNAIHDVRPELFRQPTVAELTTPDVQIMTAPPAGGRERAIAQPGAKSSVGSLVITTRPTRARVYLGDVYFGLSPLQLQLDPAIHSLRVELDGFKTSTQKVSVRDGETTELELTLDK